MLIRVIRGNPLFFLYAVAIDQIAKEYGIRKQAIRPVPERPEIRITREANHLAPANTVHDGRGGL